MDSHWVGAKFCWISFKRCESWWSELEGRAVLRALSCPETNWKPGMVIGVLLDFLWMQFFLVAAVVFVKGGELNLGDIGSLAVGLWWPRDQTCNLSKKLHRGSEPAKFYANKHVNLERKKHNKKQQKLIKTVKEHAYIATKCMSPA